MRHLVRCRYFDDEGRPIRDGCRSEGNCRFTHPGSSDWQRASKPSARGAYRGSSFGRNSDTERSNPLSRVDDRIADSTWSLPSSPSKRADKDPWASIVDSACGSQGSDKYTASNPRKDSMPISDRGWGNSKKSTLAQSNSNPWASGSGSWGDSGHSTWGDAPATLDENIAAAWGMLDEEISSKKPPEKKSGSWGEQPQASTSSNSWGRIEAKRQAPPPPTAPATTRSRTGAERAVPPISISNVSKPSVWSPMEPSSATSVTSNRSYSSSPAIPHHVLSFARLPSAKISERLNSAPSLKGAGKSREASPVLSERSLSSIHTDRQRPHYRRAIEKMVTITLLKQQLEESQRKLLRFKNIQKSPYFARVRVAGRKKLDNTRRDLTKNCFGIQTRIDRELAVLREIPDLSGSTKVDIVRFTKEASQYLAEVEEWVEDIQKRGKEKGKAKEEQEGEDMEFSEEPEPSPMQRRWEEVKERMTVLEEKLDDVSGDIEEFHNFDLKAEANAIAQDMLRAKAKEVQPPIQEQKEVLQKLKMDLQNRQELLKSMQKKYQEQLKAKTEIEKTMVTFAQLEEERTGRILSLRREIINLHNLKPVSHHEELVPLVKELVDTMVKEKVVPAFDALAVQCQKAAERSHMLASTKIDEKLRPIEAFITGIQAEATREANLVRGHH